MSIPVIKNESILLQQIEVEYRVIVPKFVHNNPKLKLNDTACFIVDSIDGINSIEEINTMVKKRYTDADEEVIRKDIDNLIYNLWSIGIVSGVNNSLLCKKDLINEIGNYSIELVHFQDIDNFLLNCREKNLEYTNAYLYADKILRKSYLEYSIANKTSYSFIIKKNQDVFFTILINADFTDLTFTIHHISIKSLEILKNTQLGMIKGIFNIIQEMIIKNILKYLYIMEKI